MVCFVKGRKDQISKITDSCSILIHRAITTKLSRFLCNRKNSAPRRRRRFDAGASDTSLYTNNEGTLWLLSTGNRRRFDHPLHILVHSLHLYRAMVRPHVLSRSLQRRRFHLHRHHVRFHLLRFCLHGSGSSPLNLRARY